MPRLHEIKRDRANKRMELNEAKALVRTKKADLRTKVDELSADQEIPAEEVDALSVLQGRVDVLEAESEALDARVSQLEMFQESDADAAVEIDQIDNPGGDVAASFRGQVQRGIGDNSGRIVPYGGNEPPRQNKKGFFVARMMVGKAWVKMGMSFDKAAAEMERRFGDKAVAKALNTAGVATGGALIPQDYVAEIIDLLRATSVIRSLEPRFLDMPRGNLTIPRLASAATANYQGELDAAQVSQQGFDTVQLNAKKLTALVPVTNDLIRRTPLGVEQVITNDLNRVAGLREDLAFILADGSQGTPVGLYNQCAATQRLTIPAFTALDNATISTATIGAANAMKLTLKNAMSGMIRPAWIMSAVTEAFLRGVRDGVGNFIYKNEMDGGKFEGIRFAVTQQIPTNVNTGTTQAPVNNGAFLIMVDMANVIVADTMNYELDVFDQATYVTGGRDGLRRADGSDGLPCDPGARPRHGAPRLARGGVAAWLGAGRVLRLLGRPELLHAGTQQRSVGGSQHLGHRSADRLVQPCQHRCKCRWGAAAGSTVVRHGASSRGAPPLSRKVFAHARRYPCCADGRHRLGRVQRRSRFGRAGGYGRQSGARAAVHHRRGPSGHPAHLDRHHQGR